MYVVHNHTAKGKTSPEYTAWSCMHSRCRHDYNPSYKYYGGAGIKICKRWYSFPNFLEDMGKKPSPKHSLDRKNSKGNYSPRNCKWSTTKEQSINKRNNRFVTHNGQTKCVAHWVKELGIPHTTFLRRLNNGTLNELLNIKS